MPRSVLVTDGEQRSSLAAVRSLGRAGYRVFVTAGTERSLAGASRFTTDSWAVPDPLLEPEPYVDRLRSIADAASIEVLLPMTEPSLLAVLPARQRLEGLNVPFPSYERFRAITDKARVAEEARRVGISVPRQVILASPSTARDGGPDELSFPLVLKPARSVGEAGEVRRKVGVVHVGSEDEYAAALARLPAQAFPVLVQERIDGTGAGVFLLVHRGRVLASFAHRRIREKPPSGGVSVCRESVATNPTLVASSRALLESFGWEGVAMVEYRIAADSGEAFIMEVNPRFWGSLQLAIDAGVDFPRLLVDAALGVEAEPVTQYDVGVRCRWWWGEVDHLIARVREARDLGGRRSSLREFRSGARELVGGWDGRSRSEIWRRNDPAPFLRETAGWLRDLLFSRG